MIILLDIQKSKPKACFERWIQKVKKRNIEKKRGNFLQGQHVFSLLTRPEIKSDVKNPVLAKAIHRKIIDQNISFCQAG